MKSAARLRLILLMMGLAGAPAGGAPDSYTSESEKTPPAASFYDRERLQRIAAEEQERFRKRVPIPDAVGEAAHAAGPPLPMDSSTVAPGSVQVTLAVVFLLATVVGMVWFVPRMSRRWNQWLAVPAKELDLAASVLAEDSSMAEFFCALHGEPQPAPAAALPREAASPDPVPAPTIETPAFAAPNPLQEGLLLVGKHLAILRTRLSELSRTPGDADRMRILGEILRQVESVTQDSLQPGLRPIWLMAFALRGLLKQLVRKAANLTPSVLRTTAAAVELLEALCVPSLRPNLITSPPVRLLAVDDDPISRRAVSLALMKTFNEPDLASDGPSALALAAQQPYDLIFLDVEMPGMDGFEVCSKIHDTASNRTTPVVFVTNHSDFDSRAKSALLGAHDLIAKPFFAFEIAVKTLTLVLKARLEGGSKRPLSESEKSALTAPAPDSVGAPTSKMAAPLPRSGRRPASPPDQPREVGRNGTGSSSRITSRGQPSQSAKQPYPASESLVRQGEPTDPSLPSARRFTSAFFMHAPEHIQVLRQQLTSAREAAQPADRDQRLGEIFLGVHSMCCEAGHAQLGAVLQLSSALEALIKKLVERPKLCTPSTLDAATATLDTLNEACQARTDLDLAQAPVRLLVVDDDPVTRRAIGGALQLAFGRPDSADCGEAALALAAEKPYDLIFLDVIMPGMDGFTTCARLQETVLNARTPVVFITGRDDTSSRGQAAASGGSGFIPKPVLASEITLVALNFMLRSRLASQAATIEPLALPAQIEEEVVETAG